MTTFFGTAPYQPDLADKLANAFQSAAHRVQMLSRTEAPLHVYFLVDCAFDARWGRSHLFELDRPGATDFRRSLYMGTRLEALKESSPFLSLIQPHLVQESIESALSDSDGKPMFSAIQSPLSLAALQTHLRRFCQIQTPDSLVFPLRLADSIGLPDILDAFDEQQRGALLSGFTAWHTINRQGGVFTIDGTCHDADSYTLPAVGEDDCIPFTDAQFVQLVDSAEGDEMLVMLFEERRALFSTAQPSVVFERVKTILKALDTRGINDMQARRNAVKRYIALSDEQIAGMYYAPIDTICAP